MLCLRMNSKKCWFSTSHVVLVVLVSLTFGVQQHVWMPSHVIVVVGVLLNLPFSFSSTFLRSRSLAISHSALSNSMLWVCNVFKFMTVSIYLEIESYTFVEFVLELYRVKGILYLQNEINVQVHSLLLYRAFDIFFSRCCSTPHAMCYHYTYAQYVSFWRLSDHFESSFSIFTVSISLLYIRFVSP